MLILLDSYPREHMAGNCPNTVKLQSINSGSGPEWITGLAHGSTGLVLGLLSLEERGIWKCLFLEWVLGFTWTPGNPNEPVSAAGAIIVFLPFRRPRVSSSRCLYGDIGTTWIWLTVRRISWKSSREVLKWEKVNIQFKEYKIILQLRLGGRLETVALRKIPTKHYTSFQKCFHYLIYAQS